MFYRKGSSLGKDIETSELQDNSVTGAKIAMGSDAQGDVLYYNGTDYARLAAGALGKFLRCGGASANPSWGAAPDIIMANFAEVTDTSETEQDTVSITSITANDFIMVECGFAQIAAASGTTNFKLRINDGTNNTDITLDRANTDFSGTDILYICQHPTTNTRMVYGSIVNLTGSNSTSQTSGAGITGLVADWITDCTISIRASTSDAAKPVLYWWRVSIMRAV